MKRILIIAGCALLLLALYWSVKFYRTVQVSKKLIHAAQPFTILSSDERIPVLVLGDSTAVGVGASMPAHSLAGLVATTLGATSLENYSVSGAKVADLSRQVAQAKLARYRLILIQVGGNDIIAFHSPEKTAAELKGVLATLPDADKTVIISAGDVGGATLFPPFVRPFHTWLTHATNRAFATVSAAEGKTFVNLSDSPSTPLITKNPKTYLAADGLHPSDAGYQLWLEAIQSSI